MSRPFSFKRFTIVQERSAMKVGTDGVLLGSWCCIREADHAALDIGAGTGLVALMLAQRGELNPLEVDAVEIDKDSAQEAEENARNSPWADRIVIHAQSIQEFSMNSARRYDLIVSNPPFFSGSLVSPDAGRTKARHSVTLSYEELVDVAAGLLTPNGRLCVIIPYEHKDDFLSIASRHGLCPQRFTAVVPKLGMQPKRALIELSPILPALGKPDEDRLLIESGERHQYSAEYKKLTRDFYLKF